ncbi:MAG: hypothetical protein LBJ87_02950 [bacterium]|nr:hypothetical protein [bacterium]
MDGERQTSRADLTLEGVRVRGVAHEPGCELPGVAGSPAGTVAGLGVA